MGKAAPVLLALALISIVLLPAISEGSPASTASSPRTPIKHVVEIVMENRAFDSLFGIYPNTSGFSGGNPYNLSVPTNLLSLDNKKVLSELKAVPNGTYTTKNPIEGYMAYHGDWNNGLMNGFINNSGPQSMTYYTAAQLAPLWVLAEQYALADNYFASVLSETSPNRLYNIAGYSPVINDYGPPPYIPFNQTIFGELQDRGLSWGYYDYNVSMGSPTVNFISGIGSYQSHVASWSSFYSNLSSGTIPDVSYLMPVGGGANGYDMGSPENVLKGEMWLLYTIDQIMRSPAWNSTAIFLTFDEGGGFYDQVAPPVLGGHQLGQRIPMILISPYAKENYISSTEMNHASMLAFIDYNWNMPALNRFVSISNLPLDMFNFNSPYKNGSLIRGPLNLTAQNGFPVPDSAYFTLNSTPSTVAGLFPMKPQIPFSDLNYSRLGSSDINISQYSATYYVLSDRPYYPEYTTFFAILALVVIDVGLAFGAYHFARRHRE